MALQLYDFGLVPVEHQSRFRLDRELSRLCAGFLLFKHDNARYCLFTRVVFGFFSLCTTEMVHDSGFGGRKNTGSVNPGATLVSISRIDKQEQLIV